MRATDPRTPDDYRLATRALRSARESGNREAELEIELAQARAEIAQLRALTPHETACALSAVRPSNEQRLARARAARLIRDHGRQVPGDEVDGLPDAYRVACAVHDLGGRVVDVATCTHCDRAAHECTEEPCSRSRAELRADAEVSDVR